MQQRPKIRFLDLTVRPEKLRWLRVLSEDVSGEQMREQVRKFLAGTHGSGEWAIFTVDGGPDRQMSHDWLVRILATAAELGSRSTTAVVLAGFEHRFVEAAADQIRDGRFLLIDQPGHGRWCGGSPRACDPKTVTAVLDLLRTQVADCLQGELDRAGPGVDNGLYRTPTLQLTEKWVDVDTLLREVVGTATAAFLIAHQMTGISADAQVLRVATVTMELVEAVARSAGVKANADVIIDEFDSSSEELERLKDGTPVILCTDLILTENSAKRALAETVNWQVVPVMVVTAFDARQHDGPMVLRDTEIPLVSLARIAVSTSVGPDAEPVDIDPVLRSVVTSQRRIERQYPWDPSEFLSACTEVERAMSVGHTGRVAHRHFTINFDVGILIAEDSPLRKQIIDRMTAEVVRGLPKSKTMAICHPDHAGEYAGRLARLVALELERVLPGTEIQMFPVPRAVLGSRWAFPERLDAVPPGCDVVLIDWGSVDAVTIHQLIRLAAEAGAGRILGLVMVSQLQKHDERALTMIQSVEGSQTVVDGEPATATVPTRVQFITALGLSAMPLNKCPLCQLARQLDNDVRQGGLPLLVQEHVERLAVRLQVRTRAEVANSPLDAFGARSVSVAIYVRLRIRLLTAMRDTATRQLVAEEFTTLAKRGEPGARHAAISLLAAERQWLTLPPLRFANCREAVAELAVSVALETDTRRRLRLQALIVLAKAAPEVLVLQSPKLWTSFSGNSLLILHLLYHLHRISQRRRGDVPVRLNELRSQIAACKDVLQDNPFRKAGFTDELEWQLTKLTYRVDLRLAQDAMRDVRDAWPALREHYLSRLRQHSDVEPAMVRLLVEMDNVHHGDELEDSSWAILQRSWFTVVTFLGDYLLPFLPPLAPVLTGAFAEEHFDAAERKCLKSLSSADWLGYVNELEAQFRRLRYARTRSDQNYRREELVSSLVVLHRTVIASGGTDLQLARLAHFLDACPTKLIQTLTARVKSANDKGWPVRIEQTEFNGDFEVFCHEELLTNTFDQLIGNAAIGKHRAAGQEETVVDLEISVVPDVQDGVVRLSFRNTGTVPAMSPGRGISTAQRKIRDFDGMLTSLTPSGKWTYEIELSLKLWPVSPRRV